MEQWVRESFASLEQLHNELDQREKDLARREAALAQDGIDLVDDSGDSSTPEERSSLKAENEQLHEQLGAAHARVQELESQYAEHLELKERLDLAATEMQAQKSADKILIEELQLALGEQRERASHEQGSVASELNDIRHALERQRQTLDDLLDAAVLGPTVANDADADASDGFTDAAARFAEIRQRVQSRRATNGRGA
jgi:DNA repair exonuclease SbcCD ATPase subunit